MRENLPITNRESCIPEDASLLSTTESRSHIITRANDTSLNRLADAVGVFD